MRTLLRQTELFRDFPDEIIKEVLLHGQVQDVSKGQFLIEPQQKVDFFFILTDGKVYIAHLFPDGGTSLMSVIESGDILGFDLIGTRSQIAPYHAVAVVPSTLLRFPADLLMKPGRIPEEYRIRALSNLLTLISHHNMKKEYRLAILSQKGLRSRVMTYLSMQASKRHTDSFRIPFNREEMASFLCVNRSALSHELSLMEREGLLSFRGKLFILHKSEKWAAQNTYEL